ncbi:MAG: hypothetical protein M0R77_09100 [Gammaproteobacteria bacterium]|nr:hypothetical protein [Gammaproteobacteria bacterium]
MHDRGLEAQFEDQIEELRDRLHEARRAPHGTDALIARGILEGLIIGYQEQLTAIRARRAMRLVTHGD